MDGIELWQNGEISVYGQSIIPDDSLTKSGYPADAKAVGDALADKLNSSELTTAVSDALTEAKASGEFDGYTPVRGTDYWTDADKVEIKSYVDEAILGGAW